MTIRPHWLVLLTTLCAPSSAQTYSASTRAFTDLGGGQQSKHYSQRATGGEIQPATGAGVASAHYRLRPGHLGQNVEADAIVVAFADAPADLRLPEKQSRPLRVQVSLDDTTTLFPPSPALRWFVVAGPISGPDADGRLLANPVATDTPAALEGRYLSTSSILALTVADVVARYTEWQENHFTPSEIATDPRAAPTASFTDDGTPNLIKYALGLDPRVPVSAPPVTLDLDADHLRLSFHRQARPDLRFEVEAGHDLAFWTTVWTATGASGPSGLLTVSDPIPLSAAPNRFLRLRITSLSP
jgi:hypothetical protein